MKKILIGMVVMFLIITTITTGVFGYLFLMKNNEVQALLNQKPAVTGDVKNPSDSTTKPTVPSTFTFEDLGQSIKVTYPEGWTHTLFTKISSDFTYEPEYGKVISKYILEFKKSDVDLKFEEILAGVDGFPFPISKTTHDYVLVTPKLVRYSEKGKNVWKYSAASDCSDSVGPFLSAEEAAASDYCVGPFFPGFAKDNAATVSATGSNAEALKEADQIVLSAANSSVK